MSKWVTLHRMVHAVESVTFKMNELDELPTNQEQAEEMLQDNLDGYDVDIRIDEVADSELVHGYTTGEGKYISLEKDCDILQLTIDAHS
jgi:hypothetical protein